MNIDAIQRPSARAIPDPAEAGPQPDDAVCRLDRKARALALLAAAAALRQEGRLALCVVEARIAGAARSEVVGTILACVPAAGFEVLSMVPAAARAFDEPYLRGQD